MSYNKNNALIKINNNSLKEIRKRELPQIADRAKRIGKIIGWGSLSLLGFGAMSMGIGPITAVR